MLCIMGIRITGKSNKKATLKIISAISSYLFEQEYGELDGNIDLQEDLRDILKKLNKIV